MECVADIEAQLRKVKVEDGDILVINVMQDVSAGMLTWFREVVQEAVEKLGVNAAVFAVCLPHGDIKLEVTKRNDLADVFQRLDDIEKKLWGS